MAEYSIAGIEEQCGRVLLKVLSCDGIPALARILEESQSESVQNRAGRTMANLAQDPGCCEAIMGTEVMPQIVQFLKNTETKECQLTYCRALRLLGSRADHRKKITEKGGILPVALLLKDEDSELVDCSIRTLADLSDQCTVEYASQVQNAGVGEHLIGLIHKGSSKSAHYALKTLLNLSEQPNIRPSIGNAGGIDCLVSLMKNEAKGFNSVQLLNALCFFCREAVNRVRIREQNVLQMMLTALEDDNFKPLQDRIISALVCFIYDEPSLNVLLSNSLVNILVQHLQRLAGFKSTTNTALWDSTEACGMNMSTPSTVDETGLQQQKETVKRSFSGEDEKARKRRKSCNNGQNVAVVVPFITTGDQSLFEKNGADRIGPNDGNNPLKCDEVFVDDEIDSDQLGQSNTEDIPFKTKDCGRDNSAWKRRQRMHVYSLDSPTYQAEYSDWNMEDFKAGVKCKQNFSSDSWSLASSSPVKSSTESSPAYSENYSPMSITTYYSPVYSPQFSPLRTRSPSPAASSPRPSSIYSGFYSPYRPQSPSGDTPEPSPRSVHSNINVSHPSDGNTAVDQWHYSSDEEHHEADKTVTAENVSKTLTEISRTLPQDEALDLSKHNRPTAMEILQPTTRKSDLHPEAHSSQSIAIETCAKLKTTEGTSSPEPASKAGESDRGSTKTKKTERKSAIKDTEENILVLLSRVSQMSNPAKFMATQECLCCLLDYLALVDNASMRAFRIVRRVLRNPNCLIDLLNVLAPVYICDKLLKDVLPSYTEAINHPASFSDHSFEMPDGQRPVSPSRKSPRTSVSLEEDGLVSGLTDEDKSNSGSSLLFDLSFVVESTFGCGTVAHILKRKPPGQRVRCTVCLPFLCRSRPAQQKILFEGGGLHLLLRLLKAEDRSSEVYQVSLQGLNFLCMATKISLTLPSASEGTNLKFPCLEMVRGLTLSLTEHGNSAGPSKSPRMDCVYMESRNDHDVAFLLGQDARLTANKSILAAASSVFQAMLEGHYTESRQTEIAIRHTSKEAFLYLLHYFHGCDENCPLIRCVHCADESRGFTVDVCQEIMAQADHYLLPNLESYLSTIARQSFLDINTAAHMYHFAILHNYKTLADDCLRYVMIADVSAAERGESIKELLSTDDTNSCLKNIHEVLRFHLAGWSN